MKLHLGVFEVPYGDQKETTGTVAGYLEDKYHVMELFVEEIGQDSIAKAFEESAKVAVEDLFSGKEKLQASFIGGGSSGTFALTADATQEIEDAFRIFIDQKELDGVVPGVPTQASLKGVNHRLKRPNVKTNPVRPSFKDTGLYTASFKAWIED